MVGTEQARRSCPRQANPSDCLGSPVRGAQGQTVSTPIPARPRRTTILRAAPLTSEIGETLRRVLPLFVAAALHHQRHAAGKHEQEHGDHHIGAGNLAFANELRGQMRPAAPAGVATRSIALLGRPRRVVHRSVSPWRGRGGGWARRRAHDRREIHPPIGPTRVPHRIARAPQVDGFSRVRSRREAGMGGSISHGFGAAKRTCSAAIIARKIRGICPRAAPALPRSQERRSRVGAEPQRGPHSSLRFRRGFKRGDGKLRTALPPAKKRPAGEPAGRRGVWDA